MGDSDKLMDVESGQKEAYEEELPSDDEEGGKVCLISFSITSFKTLAGPKIRFALYMCKLICRLQIQ